MSAVIRTVRPMSREPGEPKETKEVMGVRIDKGVPIPNRTPPGRLDSVLAAMEVGESFEHSSRISVRKALVGKRFTQRQIADKTWRIWRVK